MPYWLLWVALTPLVIRLTRRFPLEKKHWLRNVLVHLAAIVIFSAVHRAVYLLGGWILGVAVYHQQASLYALFQFMFFFNLPTAFMCYCTVLLFSESLDYYRRYQEEELKASKLETRLANAQLDALKMQLHPHFLFNTLNSIGALQLKDTRAAARMIALLGDFLRLTLENAGTQQVRLERELDFLRCYLDIQHIRFQDRLAVRFDVEPQALDAYVPNLILQPIVENAIKHGIANRSDPGSIEILAHRQNGRLLMQVKDDGPGLPVDSLKEGLGLANTRARLDQIYGPAHELKMTNSPGGGVLVTLEIPFAGN